MASAISWFGKESSQVSAHFVVGENGEVVQCVKTKDAAWHAGVVKNPTWTQIKKKVNPNLYTVGVELAGYAGKPAPFVQHLAVASLVEEIAARWGISLDKYHIIPHHAIRSDKSCPGLGVDIAWIIERAKIIREPEIWVKNTNEESM